MIYFKSKKIYTYFFLVLFIFFGGEALSLAEVKIGCIDVQKAVQMTTLGEQAKKTLEKRFNEEKARLRKVEQALKEKTDNLKKRQPLLSKNVFLKEQENLQKEFMNLQTMVDKSSLEMQKTERELVSPIIKKFESIIDDVAKKEDYTIILDKSKQNVVWMKDSVDLTKRLVGIFEDNERKNRKNKGQSSKKRPNQSKENV